ncbi:MAG TPA: 3-oxoacid CoA-transferase subunit A [Dehalococcoidia bacterium]|nr:3-oxoacid CoA-transferase subunit A [Dehalococcoidia bacterium]
MQSKIFDSFEAAVADIPDGASIMLGGFGPGTPFNLIKAIYNQGARDLHLIANAAGTGSTTTRPDLISAGDLIAQKRVRKVTLAFTASTHPSRRSAIELLEEAGELEAELVPQGTLAERIRAGGAGIPAFYTPASVGTELAIGKEHRDFKGQTYVLEEALFADYAFVRAYRADEFGNLFFRMAQRNFNPIMAMAARTTIVEAEDIIPIGAFDADQIHTSGIYVHRMVQIGPNDILHVGPPPPVPAPASGGH